MKVEYLLKVDKGLVNKNISFRPETHQPAGKEQSLFPTKAESDGHYHLWQC